MKVPTFSVVIPVRGNTPMFVSCVDKVMSASPDDTEVIIVPNGPLDEDDNGVVGYCEARTAKYGQRFRVINAYGVAQGFASAANIGLKAATGKFIVVLHDDTQVSDGWLQGLRVALRVAGVSRKSARFGYIGPVSNCAHHEQNVTQKVRQIGDAHDVNQLEHISQMIRMADASDVVTTPSLDSFCIMMTREAYETVGGFDESFDPAGYEDVDLGLRAQRAGFLSLIATRVFVYHLGQATLSRTNALGKYGDLQHLDRLQVANAGRPSDTSFAAGISVSVLTPFDLVMLVNQIRRLVELNASAIVVQSVHSADIDDTHIQEHLKNAGVWEHITEWIHIPEFQPRHLLKERNALLKALRASSPEWIWILDPNQLPASKVTAETIRRMMNPADPQTKAYRYGVRSLWNDVAHQRMDGQFASRFDQQFFRNEAWGDYEPVTDGRPPQFTTPTSLPPRNIPYTMRLVMDDYTFLNEDSIAAHKLYAADKGVVTTILSYEPTLTYLLMMKNEIQELPQVVSRFADWADDFVVVDTGSTDGSPEYLRTLGFTVVDYRCCDKALDPGHLLCDYGAARNFCIAQCQTSHILFMDADETISGKDFTQIPHLLQENCDAYVVAINNWMQNQGQGSPQKFITYQARLFKRRPEIYFAPRIHETLEEALKKHNDILAIARCDVLVEHYGYLRQTPEERKVKSIAYEQLLLECLKNDASDARSMYALGQHYNANGRIDEGDGLIARSLSLDVNFFSARQELAFRLLRRANDLFATAPPASVPSPAHERMMVEVRRAIAPWVGSALVRDGA